MKVVIVAFVCVCVCVCGGNNVLFVSEYDTRVIHTNLCVDKNWVKWVLKRYTNNHSLPQQIHNLPTIIVSALLKIHHQTFIFF
jgi:hypothetical protein